MSTFRFVLTCLRQPLSTDRIPYFMSLMIDFPTCARQLCFARRSCQFANAKTFLLQSVCAFACLLCRERFASAVCYCTCLFHFIYDIHTDAPEVWTWKVHVSILSGSELVCAERFMWVFFLSGSEIWTGELEFWVVSTTQQAGSSIL